MATFYEIYQNYLQNPYGGVNALPGVNAISGTMGATPISSMSGGDGIGEVSSVSPVGSVSNVSNVGGFGNVDTSPKGIAGLAASAVLGGPAGLALNIGTQLADLPSVSQMVRNAIAGLGFGGDSTSTGTANATDTGDMGSEAANNAATDAANASAGVGDGGGPGGGDSGDTGGPFRDGGRVGLYDGGSTFDNYRALNLGGRVGMAGGGVSQGLDYLMGIERRGYQEGTQTTPTEDFSDYLNRDTSSNILKDLYLKDIGITEKDGEPRLNILQKYLDFNKNIKNNTPLNEYVEGARSGLYSDYVDPYAEGFNLEKDYFKSPNNLRRLDIAYDPRSGKLAYYDKNEGPYGAYKYYSGDLVDQDFVDSFGLKRFDPKDEFGFSGFSTQAYGPTNEQETPTEDLINNLNTTTINTNAQTKPTVAEQMMSPEDALTPEVPQENPIQKHLDFNEFLKGQGLSQQDYNVLGGYDVAQNLAPGNPILGGAINLASPFYNLMQTFDSAKDAQGNIIKQYVPDMYEDATESGAYYTVPAQKFSDIPGSAARNIQGGLGILTNTQKQQYQDLRNQYETQRQKSAFERFTGAAGPLAENINTAISSLNPFQKQQYMNYAVQNPDQAIAAAQRNKDFLAATQKNTNPATPAPASMADGGRVFYLQGGLASLLG
jgi:hypothetical protein